MENGGTDRALCMPRRSNCKVATEITEASPLLSGRSLRVPSLPLRLQNGVSLLSAIMASSSPLLRSALCQPRRGTFLRPTSLSATKADILILISGLHATSVSRAITKFKMPAMSPTMTEGGIASWKKREGDTFTAGDVLLEIVCRSQRRTVEYLR